MIRRSGENISAVEVESVLQPASGREPRRVAATPDAVRGDEVLACIVLREDADARGRRSPAREPSSSHALARLAYYKAPGYVAFVDALPLTPSQKIQRGRAAASSARRLPGAGALRRHARDEEASAGMTGATNRAGYEGVAVAVPVTVPYVRYSTRGAHWFLGPALAALVEGSGLTQGARSTASPSRASRSRPTPRSA